MVLILLSVLFRVPVVFLYFAVLSEKPNIHRQRLPQTQEFLSPAIAGQGTLQSLCVCPFPKIRDFGDDAVFSDYRPA